MRLLDSITIALSEVYMGASHIEAEALIDKLFDRGLVIVRAADVLPHDGIDEDREFA